MFTEPQKKVDCGIIIGDIQYVIYTAVSRHSTMAAHPETTENSCVITVYIWLFSIQIGGHGAMLFVHQY